MLIRFTRLSNDRHRFEIVRDDGSSEAKELETHSTLLHDLAHYAVESEAGLGDSFYGRLARCTPYDALIDTPPQTAEAMQTEVVVVQVQNTWRDKGDRPRAEASAEATRIAAGFRTMESEPPAWLTGELIERARERLRRVQGQWRATPFHQTMELEFPPGNRADGQGEV